MGAPRAGGMNWKMHGHRNHLLQPLFQTHGLLAGAILVSLLALTGCKTGWEHRDTLKQLYRIDESGEVVHARTLKELNPVVRLLKRVAGPFGLDPSPGEVTVEEPGHLGRTAIFGLSEDLEDDPALTAEAVARFSFLAERAPFDLTRTHALQAIGKVLDRHLSPVPPATEPLEEDLPAIHRTMVQLIAGVQEAGGGSERAVPLTPDQKRDLLDRLVQTRYRSLDALSKALRVLAVLAKNPGNDPPALETRVARGIHTLGRTLCGRTLDSVLRTGRTPAARAAAAHALGKARAPWAEKMLLGQVNRESDPGVLRNVYRSLEAYRTPPVARVLLSVLKTEKTQLEESLARRALIGYTRENLGQDPGAWEARLKALGVLTEATSSP